jgi:formylglycine-generating enzyme required for sulfatase activity
VVAEVVAKSQIGSQPATRASSPDTSGSITPPPAVAPFDPTQAKQHQEAWAEHLGMPVEETNAIGMKLALIPPGEFEMGSTPEEIASAIASALAEGKQKNPTGKPYFQRVPTEAPRHHVKITKPFYLGMYQVTQAEYEKVMGVNPSAFTEKQIKASAFKPPLDKKQTEELEKYAKNVAGKNTSRHPVEMVNWDEATEFCRTLSAMPAERAARRVYRLPTEAEWEYACRAGTTTRWHSGDDEAGLADVAWFKQNSGDMTHPVGEKKPNAWGLYDMHGNVYQWCSDWFGADYYKQSPPSDPSGPTGGSSRVLRGGFMHDGPCSCRSAYRRNNAPASYLHDCGFRVVAEVEGKVESRRSGAAKSDGLANSKSEIPLPSPAVAPFDPTQAKRHQEAWAEHLGVPVDKSNSIGMKLALIPPGEFEMGSTPEEIAAEIERAKKIKEPQGYLDKVPAEGPRHHVKITKPFYLGIYQVTQAEYEKVMGTNPSAFTEKQVDASTFKPPLDQKEIEEREKDVKKVLGKDTSRHPVETVNWNEATEFCRRLSAMPAERAAGRVYRLPTEAEWEYACRAGTTTRLYSGHDEAGLPDVAWFKKNAGGTTHPVGEKKPNAWGLYDMSGNVEQWCSDWFGADYYEQSPPNDPGGPPARSTRVARGASWHYSSLQCRSAFRSCHGPVARYCNHGFRVVAEVEGTPK